MTLHVLKQLQWGLLSLWRFYKYVKLLAFTIILYFILIAFTIITAMMCLEPVFLIRTTDGNDDATLTVCNFWL